MKPFLTALGFFCLGLAVLGAILPVMPTTCFVLMAAACFAKSSPRFYNWLLASRVFGPMINQWQTTRSMPKRAKIMAITTILCSGSISIYVLDSVMLQGIDRKSTRLNSIHQINSYAVFCLKKKNSIVNQTTRNAIDLLYNNHWKQGKDGRQHE